MIPLRRRNHFRWLHILKKILYPAAIISLLFNESEYDYDELSLLALEDFVTQISAITEVGNPTQYRSVSSLNK